MAREYTVATRAQVAEGCMRRVEVGERAFVLYNQAGSLYATSDTCPHKGAPLSSGDFEDGIVICPLHAWEFDVRSGQCLSMDEWPGVPTYEVRVEGEIVKLVLEDEPESA